MATKKAAKAAKSPAAPVSTIAKAQAQFENALRPVFAGLIEAGIVRDNATKSRASVMVSCVDELAKAIPDREAFNAAVIVVCGNGERGKSVDEGGKRIPGTLAASLFTKETKVDVKSELSRLRDLAFGWFEPGVRDAALNHGLRAAHKIVKPPKAKEEEAPAEPTAAQATTAAISGAAWIMEQVRAGQGLVLLGTIASAMAATGATIEAARITEAREAIGKMIAERAKAKA